VELAYTRRSYSLSLFLRFGILEEHTVSYIALHLPNVARMRLCDVDDKECYTVFVLLIKLGERGNLPAKWRSSIAAKNEDHRPVAAVSGQGH
jgi:hypothetical protein